MNDARSLSHTDCTCKYHTVLCVEMRGIELYGLRRCSGQKCKENRRMPPAPAGRRPSGRSRDEGNHRISPFTSGKQEALTSDRPHQRAACAGIPRLRPSAQNPRPCWRNMGLIFPPAAFRVFPLSSGLLCLPCEREVAALAAGGIPPRFLQRIVLSLFLRSCSPPL